MKCSHCGHEWRERYQVCPECGKEQSKDKDRLGGGARHPIKPVSETVSKLHVTRINSMVDALQSSNRHIWSGYTSNDRRMAEMIGTKPVDGNKERLAKAVDESEALINEAITYDPRLAKRALWLRRDEGEHCDTALLAQGDDQPFYKRTKNVVNDETRAGEPFRIVISTDDDKIPDGAASSFIATVRIVQQFVPVEVWWQGSWLDEHRRRGFVFHVPLVQGDMDFSRLEFCIADRARDIFSYKVMTASCVLDLRESWNNCGYRAEKSYLPESPGYQHFIAHTGIQPTASSIASHAAQWLGWEQIYMVTYEEQKSAESALQTLPDASDGWKDTRTKAQKDEADRDYRINRKKQKRQEALEASGRLG